MEQRAGPGRTCLSVKPIDFSRVSIREPLHYEADVLGVSAWIHDQMDVIVTHMNVGNAGRVWNSAR